jgi:hypothetical protein
MASHLSTKSTAHPPPTLQPPLAGNLTELVALSDEQRKNEPTNLLSQMELDWSGHEVLFVQLLKLRDGEFAFALLEGNFLPDDKMGELDIGPIEWWLEWLIDEKDPKLWWWLRDRISRLFATHLKAQDRNAFVAEFNKPRSRFRRLLAHSILNKRRDLTTDSFSEDAISFLLADLNREGSAGFIDGHLLGSTATEAFVTERLLPLIPEAKEPLLRNLQDVLRQAGSRHGRRYITQ